MHPIPFIDDLRRGRAYEHALELFSRRRILLPTIRQLAEPETIPRDIRDLLSRLDPDEAVPLNLFRVHWFNGPDRRDVVSVPAHLVLPPSLTGVEAQIVVALACRFPMIRAHKVLAAYGCLVPRLIGGHFDPIEQRAVWPSTGNYCRGGIAISNLMGCPGIAVLPEGMSRERFEWLERWIDDPNQVITTAGTESNVRAIFDKCRELAADPRNVVFDQFTEFGNYLIHYTCTGRALEVIVESLRAVQPGVTVKAFVAATGSSGTLAAGDYLKERYDAAIVAVEPLECPTMLYNGFGEHNIQGIGDKHIPLIHNVMNTDVVMAVSDRSTDALNVLFNTEAGREYLAGSRDVPQPILEGLEALGLSSICNVVAAIKTARVLNLGAGDVVLTVATDAADMYASERQRTLARQFDGAFGTVSAADVFERHIANISSEHTLRLSSVDRDRIFNLGYYTWVEQEGVAFDDFMARRDPAFWSRLRAMRPIVDELIADLNAKTAMSTALRA